MKTLHITQFTGRKQRAGAICFDESGRLCIFVNYCEDCKGKVVMKREEAEVFAHQYRQITNTREYKRLLRDIKKYQLA